MKVGDTTVEDLDYGPLCSCAAAAVKPTCPLRAVHGCVLLTVATVLNCDVFGPADEAIALIKEAGLPVRLSFKRAPVTVKGLFGSVARPSEAGGASTTQMPSFNFGVAQKSSSAGSSGSTAAAGVFKFGSGSTAPASTSSSSFSFGVTKAETATANGDESPGDGKDGVDVTSLADGDGDGDDDAKE